MKGKLGFPPCLWSSAGLDFVKKNVTHAFLYSFQLLRGDVVPNKTWISVPLVCFFL